MIALPSAPVAFASLLAGAVIVEYGARNVKSAFAGGTPTGTAPSASASIAPGSHGAVTTAALANVGSRHHWGGSELTDWMRLIMLESNGELNDTNPSSGAYGIAQGITGPGWYAAHGGDATTVVGQLTAMANYIAGRYGTPSAALRFHEANGWY